MGVGEDEGRRPSSLPGLRAPGVEGGLGMRTRIFSGTEGLDASRAEHQRLEDVGEGHHAQEMLAVIH